MTFVPVGGLKCLLPESSKSLVKLSRVSEKDYAFPCGECILSILASFLQKWKVKLAENPFSLGMISGFLVTSLSPSPCLLFLVSDAVGLGEEQPMW